MTGEQQTQITVRSAQRIERGLYAAQMTVVDDSLTAAKRKIGSAIRQVLIEHGLRPKQVKSISIRQDGQVDVVFRDD